MAAGTSSAGFYPYIIFILVILFVLLRVVRRTVANYRGTKFSLSTTYVFSAIYVGIGVVFSLLSFFEGVTILLAFPEAILAAAAAVGSYRYTDRRISFWKGADGDIYFKGGVIIYLIYIVGLVARLAIDLVLIGPSSFDFSTSVVLSGTALYGSTATDLLLTFGVGLLLGRSLRVARRYDRIISGQEALAGGQARVPDLSH